VKASEALGQAVEKMAAYDSHLRFQSRVPAEEAYHFFDRVSPVVEVGLEPAAASSAAVSSSAAAFSAGFVVRLANCHLAYSCLAQREP
jgi:pyrroline-5-carboxylate reductase